MAGARYLHGAAPILFGTAVLVAGGSTTPISLSPPLTANLGDLFGSCGTSATSTGITAAEIFHENTLGWTAAAPMNVARAQFTMVTLFNGQVLAAGGGSAEIYNPASDTWTLTSGMQATRFGAAGTLLPGGRVFLAGGDSGGGFLGNFCPADAEVYDPSVDTWFNAGGMTVNHWHGTATLYHLPDGSPRVLVAGGYDGNNPNGAIATVESWNPGSNTFIPVPDMLIARVFHDATLRSDGKILVTGGINELGDLETISEVYDPVTNSWSVAAPMIFPHAGHNAVVLADVNGHLTDKILVAGGLSGGGLPTATAEIFQPTPLGSKTFIETQTLPNSNAVSACQPDVIIATVSSSSGLGTPTGAVSFLGNFGGVLVGLGPTGLNQGVYSLDAVLPAGSYQIFARYSGDSNFLASDSQTLPVQSVPPPIAVFGPTKATAGNQITLTASVPNGAVTPYSFVWTLPNGANLNGNGNGISVTPAVGQNQYAVNGSDSNGCALGPAVFTVTGYASGVVLNSQVEGLSRNASTGTILAVLLITNNGSDTASVQVTGSTLNNIPTSAALPVSLGNLGGSGQQTAVFLQYPGTAGATGTSGVLRLNLTYTDVQTGGTGNAGGAFRVIIP
jgi:hypothetical protein